MSINSSRIKKILVISLSNIGDVVLTFPVIDILKRDFPKASLTMVVGPRAESLIKGNPHIHEVIVFDKRDKRTNQIQWMWMMRRKQFDLIVDLRHSAIPLFLPSRYRTPVLHPAPSGVHMKHKHLSRLKTIYPFASESPTKFALHISKEDRIAVEAMLDPFMRRGERFIVIAPGAASHLKRWSAAHFAMVADVMSKEEGVKIVFVGDKSDQSVVSEIKGRMKEVVLDLSGQTTLLQLAAVIEKAKLILANDSGTMHLASYLDVPVVAIFGPTDPFQYGPWGRKHFVLKSEVPCPACQDPQLDLVHGCLSTIAPQSVLTQVRFSLLSA